MAIMPQTRMAARANRAFLGRVVRHLAGLGVRQFLDIGTGIPGPGNTGEVAHTLAPDARVVYVDNDPIVLAHAEALLAKADRARTTVISGDLRDPAAILANPRVREVLDFAEPLAVLLIAVLHFVREDENPYGVVRHLMDAMPPGGFLALSHATGDFDPASAREGVRAYTQAGARFVPRTRSQFTASSRERNCWNPASCRCRIGSLTKNCRRRPRACGHTEALAASSAEAALRSALS